MEVKSITYFSEKQLRPICSRLVDFRGKRGRGSGQRSVDIGNDIISPRNIRHESGYQRDSPISDISNQRDKSQKVVSYEEALLSVQQARKSTTWTTCLNRSKYCPSPICPSQLLPVSTILNNQVLRKRFLLSLVSDSARASRVVSNR